MNEMRNNRIKDLEKEIIRLRGMIDQSADGELLPDCEQLFCPHCNHEVRIDYDIAYCDYCVNWDDGRAESQPPLPLSLIGCLANPKLVKAKR